MDSKGPYSPPSGGNSQGGEGACKALVLTDMEGSIPSPPTEIPTCPDISSCEVCRAIRRWAAQEIVLRNAGLLD